MTEPGELADASWLTSLEASLEGLSPRTRYDELAREFFVSEPEGEPPVVRLVLQSLLVRIHGVCPHPSRHPYGAEPPF